MNGPMKFSAAPLEIEKNIWVFSPLWHLCYILLSDIGKKSSHTPLATGTDTYGIINGKMLNTCNISEDRFPRSCSNSFSIQVYDFPSKSFRGNFERFSHMILQPDRVSSSYHTGRLRVLSRRYLDQDGVSQVYSFRCCYATSNQRADIGIMENSV